MNILLRLDHLLVYSITESRKISNFFWAFIIFLGSLGLLLVAISSYIGGGYDIFDKKKRKVCFFRWGFPGKNRRIILEVPMKEIQSIRIITGVIEGGIFTRTLTYESLVYMETIEQGFIPLTRIEDNLTPLEIADKAAELSMFLGVPLSHIVLFILSHIFILLYNG
uniref:Photosystem I assembly protein Ycf4 n=1 Tax=Cajanus cajan TaxID=3821 RepID=A0A151T7F4_CAJCA|nr:Photosystem I assembly protein ycf4 [Cajanus cajan]